MLPTVIDDDPEVDILLGKDQLTVIIDLRGRDSNKLLVKANKRQLYVYDKETNSVIKIISLPTYVEPESIKYETYYGTYIVSLKKVRTYE
ncbi:hypothetical protein KN1_20520 [Stygiolobus caldivivus]|uniref:SHSP domain-containing protein n=1 Tax=Stygiolobus caldivivus TaxID=2824673 RepID=A0A8D5ZJV6_9CREN|nr:hypothetical protein KN1_20520 [Stygiolobus caldivivus]